jgi:hypothetical protein
MEKEEVEKDVDKYAKLESLALSEGGVLLLDSLKSDILSSVDSLICGYKKLPHIELISIIAQLESKFGIYKILKRSNKNKKLAKEALEQILNN